ncbi:MAG: adenine phosphoribosyltransferase [Candidatus Melainabacteria bacterium]|nr:adenine phosphoribosyltransferase [Candidatus Melainabacteria bacterium]
MTDTEYLDSKIRDIPDFPKPGIIFKDITTLLSDPKAFKISIDMICDHYKAEDIDFVACPESRGFIWGAPAAAQLLAGMTLIRKPGKLPAKTIEHSYELEYGEDTLCIHEDAFAGVDNARVLIVDDLLATGGSAAATAELIKQAGGTAVGLAVAIELDFLEGRKKLEGIPVHSLLHY